MVTGKIVIGYCDINRRYNVVGCGSDAKWFEPKPEPVEKKPFWKFW
jgi:hypothetical protein